MQIRITVGCMHCGDLSHGTRSFILDDEHEDNSLLGLRILTHILTLKELKENKISFDEGDEDARWMCQFGEDCPPGVAEYFKEQDAATSAAKNAESLKDLAEGEKQE